MTDTANGAYTENDSVEQGGGDHHEWDARWARIREMQAGPHDPYTDFAKVVTSTMEELGNEVGRPFVMKVTVEVKEGPMKRPESDQHE